MNIHEVAQTKKLKMKKVSRKDPRRVYEEARKDPRQISIFGPVHERELQELYAIRKKAA